MMTYLFLGLTLAPGQAPTVPPSAPPAPLTAPAANGNGDAKDKDKGDDKDKDKDKEAPQSTEPGFLRNFFKAYKDEFGWCQKDDKKEEKKDDAPEPARRAPPAPFRSPSFPGGEWQGYPNIGVPPADFGAYPIMKGLYATPAGDCFKDNRIFLYGWVTSSFNASSSKNSNTPASYAIVPNRLELDQAVLRLEREADTVQTDHLDWGFRMTGFYGIDYRYTTAGGDFSDQLLKNNRLNGFDPLEYYGELYIPGIADGLVLRLGRYISPPDIEAQLAPDNYLASHSILFTYDNYTQTGLLATLKLNNQWMVQAGINAGGDMAPWYKGALPTGFLGVRWISKSNHDSVYTCYNDINNAKYRQFMDDGQPAGHDNYNYVVSTWSHRFNEKFITATEAYYMWELNSPLGGTPSIGPVEPFGGGGGEGAIIPGHAAAYGVLNYTAYQLSKSDFVTLRNEWWDDNKGMRSGFATNYSSHTIGLTHNVNSYFQIRPEIGYYHSYNVPAFDLGTRFNQVMFEVDFTLRF